jgi:hypothetical protein
VIDLLRRVVAGISRWFRRTETGGVVSSYNDEDLIREYINDVAIGTDRLSVAAAIKDGYGKLEGKRVKPPYRVVEIWADGENPFTEFRVILKGDGTTPPPGGAMASEDDQKLIGEYIADVAIGTDEDTVAEAIKQGYEKLERKGVKPPYRVVEIWAHGTNPFTEFRVIMKGDGS